MNSPSEREQLEEDRDRRRRDEPARADADGHVERVQKVGLFVVVERLLERVERLSKGERAERVERQRVQKVLEVDHLILLLQQQRREQLGVANKDLLFKLPQARRSKQVRGRFALRGPQISVGVENAAAEKLLKVPSEAIALAECDRIAQHDAQIVGRRRHEDALAGTGQAASLIAMLGHQIVRERANAVAVRRHRQHGAEERNLSDARKAVSAFGATQVHCRRNSDDQEHDDGTDPENVHDHQKSVQS